MMSRHTHRTHAPATAAVLARHTPLVAMTRDTHTDVRVRIRILNMLTNPEAVAAASANSLWDYLEPAELKAARLALGRRVQA